MNNNKFNGQKIMAFGLIDDDLTNDMVTINDEQNEF